MAFTTTRTHIRGFPVDKFGRIRHLQNPKSCPPGFTLHAKACQDSSMLHERFGAFFSQKAEGFGPTLLHVGPAFVAGIATLLTAGAAAPAVATLAGGAKLAATAAFKIGAAALTTPKLVPKPQGGTMALNLGGILSTVGGIFGGAQNPYFQGVSNVANLASQFFPAPTASFPGVPMNSGGAVQVAAAGPIARSVVTGGAMVSRGFFSKFPALATAMQQLRARGMSVKRSQLWSMLKRFGPEALVGGGLLTAAAVSELMVAGPGHRRMNPANVKALRRSLRRLNSFHRLCTSADKLRAPRRRGCKTGSRSGSTQFVRQG